LSPERFDETLPFAAISPVLDERPIAVPAIESWPAGPASVSQTRPRLGLAPYPSAMTSLDLPPEHPPPADSQVDAEGAGTHSGEEEGYELSAAAALLGMAAALPMYSLSQNSPGSVKRGLFDDPRQLPSVSRGSSSDDLSSISSNDGGGVKRQRSGTKDHGGAHIFDPAPRAARASVSCPRLLSSTT
jgi:hypothetical protein